MRKFMKDFTNRFTRKQLWLGLVAGVSLMLVIILQIVSFNLKNPLKSQQMAQRWDDTGKSAQVSCFISENTQVTVNQLVNFEHAIDAALLEASLTTDNENARLWADAYSARGELTVESEKTSITATAIGVGGDFFLFHPLQLENGSYFTDDDLMQDYVILDEDAAWQLFGSNDVAGMQVTIKGIPHYVKGVIKRGSGRMNDKAGNDETTVYVSYNSLSSYGTCKGINAYEIVMPNPITGFALKTVKEKIGIDETNIELVENSNRFSLLTVGTVLLDFGTRSMNQKDIIYPYWENIARGYEDVLALILLWKSIFLIIPIVIGMSYLIYRYKYRSWNAKTIVNAIVSLKERVILKPTNTKSYHKFLVNFIENIKAKSKITHTKRKK
ncbi:MAG: ABC transporter permease [Lachnotalea sp.]